MYLAAKVSKSQNPFTICQHDDLYFLLRPISQYLENSSPEKILLMISLKGAKQNVVI